MPWSWTRNLKHYIYPVLFLPVIVLLVDAWLASSIVEPPSSQTNSHSRLKSYRQEISLNIELVNSYVNQTYLNYGRIDERVKLINNYEKSYTKIVELNKLYLNEIDQYFSEFSLPLTTIGNLLEDLKRTLIEITILFNRQDKKFNKRAKKIMTKDLDDILYRLSNEYSDLHLAENQMQKKIQEKQTKINNIREENKNSYNLAVVSILTLFCLGLFELFSFLFRSIDRSFDVYRGSIANLRDLYTRLEKTMDEEFEVYGKDLKQLKSTQNQGKSLTVTLNRIRYILDKMDKSFKRGCQRIDESKNINSAMAKENPDLDFSSNINGQNDLLEKQKVSLDLAAQVFDEGSKGLGTVSQILVKQLDEIDVFLRKQVILNKSFKKTTTSMNLIYRILSEIRYSLNTSEKCLRPSIDIASLIKKSTQRKKQVKKLSKGQNPSKRDDFDFLDVA